LQKGVLLMVEQQHIFYRQTIQGTKVYPTHLRSGTRLGLYSLSNPLP